MGVIAMVFLSLGGTLIAFAFTPMGRAIADNIRHGPVPPGAGSDPQVYEELERVREELAELQERMDFAERMLGSRETAKELAP